MKQFCYLVLREDLSRSGDISEVVTPVPIPNTEVKHFSGDNSYASHSEDSSLPGNLDNPFTDYPFFML